MKNRRFVIDPDTKVLLKQMGIGFAVIFTVGLLITAVWYSTRLTSFTIVDVTVVGGETVNVSEIERAVQSTLDGSYLGIIPRRFTWLYPEAELLQQIDEVPRVYDIEINRQSKTELLVTFNEYTPDGLWCQSTENDNCVFINDQAYAYDRAPQLSGGSLLRFVKLGEDTVVGDTMLDTDSYQALVSVVDLLEDKDLFASHVEFDQVGDAFIGLVGGGELKILIEAPPEQTVENLEVILQSQDFMHLEPGNFQYIDLRFGEKIFVKEALVEPEMQLETASSSEVTAVAVEDNDQDVAESQ